MQLQGIEQSNGMTAANSLSAMLTVVIPVRIDCEERKANLMTVLRHIKPLGCRVIVLEADESPKLADGKWPEGTEYVFREDRNPVFHRTRYINILLHMADTETVAVWDTDVLLDLCMVDKGVILISSGTTVVYPYNGGFVMLGENMSKQVRKKPNLGELSAKKLKSVFLRPFCGGVYMVHRLRYLQCGGENENFTGWGPEDAERFRRIRNLGHTVVWCTGGQAYHLWHPRGTNSWFADNEAEVRLKMEMVKVSSMTREELQNYISSERWNKTSN